MRPKNEGGAAGSPDTATWEAFAVFRETFLANLPEEDATALRQVGRRMYLDRMEAFRLEDGKGEESPTCADLRAAAADLAVMAGFFSSVGAWADLPPKEAALARLARDCATLLTDLEERLVAALSSDSQKEDLDGELAN